MTSPSPRGRTDFLAGGGHVGQLMRAKHWGDTPLGEPESWPQSLKTIVRMLLSSRYQMWLGWGPDLTFFCNDAYLPTLGVKHGWALGAPTREVWKEIWPEIERRFAQIVSTGSATWDEGLMLFLERSGYAEETYHTFSYSPLSDDEGAIAGMLCVVTEETERIIGARRLSHLRELAAQSPSNSTRAAVLDAAAAQLNQNQRDLPFTLTYLFDPSGKAQLVARSGFTGENPFAPREIDPQRTALWPAAEILANRGAVRVTNLAERFADLPLGAWDKPATEAVVAPMARPGEKIPAGFLVVGVNPYRRLDESYLGYIDLLAGQLAQGLANAEAHESAQRRENALAELDRAKTTFFSNVSHELRTPLTLILGPLEDLINTPETQLPQQQQLLRIALRNGVRLLKLVNTLLDFSRIEAGRMQANFEPVDLAQYSAELASAFRSTVERAGLELKVKGGPLPRPVFVDRDMWEKIVLNLVSNAFKFTFTGEIEIEVASTPRGTHAELRVRDTGCGIPEGELPHIFDRFRRVEGARGRSMEGSGIGLALVQELVKAHGGTIRVKSALDVGSTFTVSLPYGSEHLSKQRMGSPASVIAGTRGRAFIEEALAWISDIGQPSAPNSTELEPTMSVRRPMNRTVLLADDNSDMRDYLRKLLEAAGFHVTAVGDGERALEAARIQKPDLLLSDVMMPRMDGFKLLAALRADPQLKDVPVLLLSARAGEEAKVEGLAAGASDYLTKPFSARELIARVRANLEIAELRRESEHALRLANESLERQIVERTRDLSVKEARLRSIFSTSYVLNAFLSVDGTVLDANAVSLNAIGGTLNDVVGRKYWDTPWFSGSPGMAELIQLAVPLVAGGELFQREFKLNLPKAGWRWFDFQMRPVRDAGGAVVAIVPEAVDVTARRSAEAALRQAQKMEGIGQLTGGVAHDFNNLLTIIGGSLETLRRSLAQPVVNASTIERALDSASRGAQRAASLTQRLLAFARQQPLDPKPVDLSRLVAGMSDLLRRTLGEQIAIETALAGGLWRVNIDANQLEIAIINLAVNARDAMPTGGKLTIETGNAQLDELYAFDQAEVVPGQYVLLAVSDTGIGMDGDTLANAFEPFFTTKDVGHGTGLGLSQVYGFVKQSGGHVKIYSEPGAGTTVRIYLPRLYSADAPLPSEPAAKVAQAGHAETILAVEDDPDVRAHTVGVLRELGYQVLEAPNGRSALELLKAHPEVDLMFSDVGLPGGMNGRQLAEEARKHRPHLKVLFTSGYARSAIVHGGRLEPGVQLITKPFSFAALSDKLRDLLDAGSGVGRILVIEDEDLIQMLLVNHLEELGFDSEVAGSAAEAKSKLLLMGGAFDAIISDLGLPDARGESLVNELRETYPNLPVVISSGYDKGTLQERFAGVGRVEFLSKPFTQEQLAQALQRIGVLDA
jgi:PAS domain S-box-containing protein